MKKIFTLLFFITMINSIVFAGRGIDIPEYILVKTGDGKIEEIELDTYLYSVVQSEMGTKYKASGMSNSDDVPLEALKAQAVASRSYAVYNILRADEDADYHVTSTVTSQVYNKNANIADIVKEAVDETTGQVITYDDEVACAYFFSTSGGHTEAPENVWSSAIPYLKGVEDEYEIEVDNKTSWTVIYTQSDLKKLFPKLGEIKDIIIEEYSENDRVVELKIVGSKGKETLTKNNIRMKMGTGKLRSQWFDVEFDGNEAVFEGRGFGHGIGMSQNGAIGMALEGFSYDEILEWYYTDIEIYGFDDYSYRYDEDDYDEEYYIPEEELEEVELPKPLLEKTIEICTTNWLANYIGNK
ncbi:MAG: SpoIID/LytB domain-containing protein [Clostridia bacterium]|nr:SpoIID/LytB domain-containing protein [Clostridia bacterium]